jgi:phosphopantothenoylcysteine decarboxylase / phosphopantothenate---cysteine ligase
MLRDKKILIGVCGGIAAYKVCYLIREIKRLGADVKVVMTPSATNFITPLTFSTLSNNKVSVDMFPEKAISDTSFSVDHINYSLWADLILIAPATANTIAKLANGIADNLLTSIVLAARSPILLAPSMDVDMYENSITQDNLSRLNDRGFVIIEPDSGELASGLKGKGRLPETSALIHKIEKTFSKKDLLNKKILITAGPTREMIDPVRYISNRSSGKMGIALAQATALRGAQTTLICGPTQVDIPQEIKTIRVIDAEEMSNATMTHFNNSDIVIMAAAVSDYRPLKVSKDKIKKGEEIFSLDLIKTDDILKHLGKNKTKQFVIGFAVETSNEIENAKAKLIDKNLDMIVLNNPLMEGAAFDVDTNIVTIITKDGRLLTYDKMLKSEVANIILDKTLEF